MVQFLSLPVCQLPSPQGDDPLGIVLLVSPQESSQEKGALQCTRPSKKSPFKTRERKKRSAGNVLRLLVSMTNGFVCQLVCYFFNWKGNQDSILRNFPWDAWEHFLLDHISIIFPWCPHKTSSLSLLPCLPKGEKKLPKKHKGRRKNMPWRIEAQKRAAKAVEKKTAYNQKKILTKTKNYKLKYQNQKEIVCPQ